MNAVYMVQLSGDIFFLIFLDKTIFLMQKDLDILKRPYFIAIKSKTNLKAYIII